MNDKTRQISIAALIISLSLVPPCFAYKAKVVQVADGDTVVVEYRGKKRPVHLGQIDCPQLEQPFGPQAAAFTRQQVHGKVVEVIDERGFVANDVRTPEGRSLSFMLMRKGLAWYPKNYSRKDPLVLNAEDGLASLERRVRRKRIGLWGQARPQAPWALHKNRETTLQIANLPNVRIGVS